MENNKKVLARTQEPWIARDLAGNGNEMDISAANGVDTIATIYNFDGKMKENVAFILRARDSHAALLEACKSALPLLEQEWSGTGKNSDGSIVIKEIELAIAKAEAR